MRNTGEAKAGLILPALLIGAGLWMGSAAAGEPVAEPASWGAAVSSVELGQQRGASEDAVSGEAVNNASQVGTNTNSAGGDVINTAGAVTLGSHTFDNQTMSINAINTGNNVNMQNTLAIMLVIQ